MTLTPEVAREATGGELLNPDRFPSELRITTDTRTVALGETFLALRGERFDGHGFIAQALERGAAAIVADRADAVPSGVPALIVPDTTRAYMALAGAVREEMPAKVIGITGSTGKTTTKHLLGQLLTHSFGPGSVLATPANENNEIGVSKLLLQARAEHRAIVVEMGARHEGEIAQLARIARPHIGVLTNIGEAHLEIFGSRERLAETKWGLFAYGAQAVLSAGDAESMQRAPSLESPPFWFGSSPSSAPGVWIPDSRTMVLTVSTQPESYAIDLHLPGAHNRTNLAAAIAAALLAGADIRQIVECIPTLTLPSGRFETITIEGAPRIIYDAYNANLSGMLAALDAFAAETGRRRIAVLASMAELGSQASEMHERVGAKVASLPIDVLLAGGDFAADLKRGALEAGFPRERIVPFSSNEEAAHWIETHASPHDAVLLKGSRKYAMEQIVELLRRKAVRA
ncbi:MAG TPA: UDP-N-acetylmuramoyl-tripeptide--D-alanyl-D-alanine ligase [Candidatus Baltobacteraceae bacterium]|nr:UDP-N-acetylmuramoyl-tripeptide--D-alanyl-D-alanine ligase [Candidatus Baltobacteraceae bacterium]